jgi:hypothetical protein
MDSVENTDCMSEPELSDVFIIQAKEFFTHSSEIYLQSISDEKMSKLRCFKTDLLLMSCSVHEKVLEDMERAGVCLNWSFISQFQQLSSEFILKHQDKINWEVFVQNQLSMKIFRAFSHKLNWQLVKHHYYLPDQFVAEFSHLL